MSSSELEMIDVNIVVLPAAPVTHVSNTPQLLESDQLKPLLKGVTAGQILQLDATTGNVAPMLSFDSMRSRRSVIVGANRFEVHDRSGERDFDATALARIIDYLVRELKVDVRNVGTNVDVTFSVPNDRVAAQAIASTLLSDSIEHIVEDGNVLGGAGRIFLERSNGVRHTVIVEPRFNDLDAKEVYMTTNANLITDTMPSVENLVQFVQDNCRVLQNTLRTLFSVSWYDEESQETK